MIFGENFWKFRKIFIFVIFSTNFDFCQIFEKFRVCSKFPKNFWKISKNIDLGQNFRKIWISSKIPNNFDFSQIFDKYRFESNFRKIWIWVKFFETLGFLRKFRLISILVNRKISILVKLSENFDFGQIFLKFSFYSQISKNFDFGQIFEKFKFWSNFRKFRKMSI